MPVVVGPVVICVLCSIEFMVPLTTIALYTRLEKSELNEALQFAI